MVNLGEAYRKLIGKTVRATRVVVARQANKQKTNKISSPQPSPKERECSNGKVRQKNEQTNDGASHTGR